MRALLIVILASIVNVSFAKAADTAPTLEAQDSTVVEAQTLSDVMTVDQPAVGSAPDVTTEAPPSADMAAKHHAKRQNPCKAINADATQKAAIKAAVEAFKTGSTAKRTAVRAAHKNLLSVIKDANSDATAANTAIEALNAAGDAVRADSEMLKVTILYTILKPEQRATAVTCMMMMKHHGGQKQQHHGKRRPGQNHQGHTPHHGHRGNQNSEQDPTSQQTDEITLQ